jgi:AcrR family transcriptional regulator
MPAVALAPRRTQAERRASTRAALLDAAVACLLERGHAGTTTPAVCARAGLSQGALFKHFPSKPALVGAAAAQLFEALTARYLDELARVSHRADQAEAAVRALWTVFQRPELMTALELYLAARSDPALAAALGPVMNRHARQLRELARRLFPAVAAAPRFAATLDLLLELLQGMALSHAIAPDPTHERRVLALAIDLAREAIAPPRRRAAH